jgi:threonylcarbamoyladenosine tRNA methylthiotransferase MtaB
MKVSFYTLGCRLNQAETAVLQQQCAHHGYTVVDGSVPADVVVINTCTVTEHGDSDTRRLINKVRRLNANARIALVGCQSQVQSQQLAELPGVHWVIGTAAKMNLVEILQQPAQEGPVVVVPEISRKSFTVPVSGIDRSHTRANLKIQDGCDFFCSYCEIPYARGRARSREFDDLVREAGELVQAGHRELVLTGINVGLYNHEGKSIADVVQALHAIPDLLRMRISSIEATTIPPRLFEFMKQGRLCRFLHLPLQSASDTVLQRMHRKYTLAEYDQLATKAQESVPGICLGTDILVGFPGETETEFEQTYNYLRESGHAYFHVFSYSDRINNTSRHFADKVSPAQIEKRSQALRSLSAQKRQRHMEACMGRDEMVLFEQQKNGYWTGVTDTYIRVRVRSARDLHNRFLAVHLLSVDHQTMIGRLA